MATTQEAIEGVKQLKVRLQSIFALAEHLERIQSIEQSEAEARVRLDRVGKDLEAARGELSNAKASIDEARKQADQIVSQAHANAQGIKNKADTDAETLMVNARLTADELVNDAARKSTKMVSAASAQAAKSNEAATAAEARRQAAEQAVAEKSKEFADITRKIDAAKARAAEMLK